MTTFEVIVLTIVTASTPLLLAAIGELVVERAGMLNLSVEGMMLMGAVTGFIVANESGSLILGVVASLAVGACMSLFFAAFTLWLVTNQIATGLAFGLLGIGLSGLIGESYTGRPGIKLPRLEIAGLTDLPWIGKILFGQDPLVYASVALVGLVAVFLNRTHAGLKLKATGIDHRSAHTLGISVVTIRITSLMFGGACSGLAGAYLSLAYTPQWVENMSAGRGWIAIALVVFATWIPGKTLAGAYLFGTIWILGLHVQGIGLGIPSQLLSALPYVVTIVVMALLSSRRLNQQTAVPHMIGRPFEPER